MSDGRTVYIIDDDEPVRDSLAFSLRSQGFKVQVAVAATDFLRSSIDEQSACLISDIRLPGMDGLELTRVLRARLREAHLPYNGLLLPYVGA